MQTCTQAVFFSRSSAIRSPSFATLFWMGDQLVTFDSNDGMQSAMLGMLSGGLSGHSLAHTDLGGYTMVDQCLASQCLKYLRSKGLAPFTHTYPPLTHASMFSARCVDCVELLLRWMEMSAFSDVIFRTHPGNIPNLSVQVYSDDGLLKTFGAFARVHSGLGSYRLDLMKEASITGAPVTRHPWLTFPTDVIARGLTTQFMMGPDIMVAPGGSCCLLPAHRNF